MLRKKEREKQCKGLDKQKTKIKQQIPAREMGENQTMIDHLGANVTRLPVQIQLLLLFFVMLLLRF